MLSCVHTSLKLLMNYVPSPVPVSHPVFTFSLAGAQAVMGDVVELHCEAQRGSPPILYWFYHKNVTLGNSSAPFGGGMSFNLTLTAEHSGNYSCGADNGLGVQRSEVVTLNITGPSSNKYKASLITVGVPTGLLSILGLAAATAVLVGYFRTQRSSGGHFATGTPSYSPSEFQEPSWSRTSNADPQNPKHSEPPALQEPQPVYSNANSPRRHWEDKEPTIIYSELKKAYPDDSTEQDSNRNIDEDATENYENVPCTSSAVDH
ncbi:Fc receptor-like protein 3 [Camelus dromedarius]|uniref:Fc receptor-like protein 3 n=1 Tax=Camelus dromedarius TaxID=9838 RepID=A0A5N4CNU3_CAMDR|nr:Fc receptor-like protein 3 [Camelus dromedarius]